MKGKVIKGAALLIFNRVSIYRDIAFRAWEVVT